MKEVFEMKKILALFPMIFLLIGCFESKYTKDKSITKYVLDKYKTILNNNKIQELKCFPSKQGYNVYYFESKRPNNFPATILIEKLNGKYIILFDKEYKKLPKNILINDIDGCFKELKRILEVDDSWK